MPHTPGRFPWLAHEFDSLVESLNECESLQERRKLLRRMKVLINEIDALIFSTLKRDKQDTVGSPSSNQPTVES
jgi:hypothetical protein